MESLYLLPGESFPLDNERMSVTKQFTIDPAGNTKISPKVAGTVVRRKKNEALRCAIIQEPKKYYPEINDYVIGCIKSKMGESYVLDIGGCDEAVLGFYDFEGATKRNRPILNVGNLIYARVVETNKFLRTRLSCTSLTSKKEWVTGEAFFGDLKEGMVLNFSIAFCRNLVQDKKSDLLNLIKKYVSFEICIGINGRIWVKSSDLKNTIIILNSLTMAQKMDLVQFEEHLKKISPFFIA